jgi:hypothetical protein
MIVVTARIGLLGSEIAENQASIPRERVGFFYSAWRNQIFVAFIAVDERGVKFAQITRQD